MSSFLSTVALVTLLSSRQDGSHHLTGPFLPPTQVSLSLSLSLSLSSLSSHSPVRESSPNSFSLSRPASPVALLTPAALQKFARFSSESEGLCSDLKSMRWMRVPASSFKMILYPTIFYFNYRFLQVWNLVPPDWYNPFQPLLFISHRLPDSHPDFPRYQKGYLDLLFIAFYVIVWSFVRQLITLHMFHPLARRYGIKKPAKLDRFGEQGYAVLYFSLMSSLGLVSYPPSTLFV
jgi:very-long-chain ceramide synthase